MAKRVLQLCHGYNAPFLDVAKQWVRLFSDTDVSVTTVFLTGKRDEAVASEVGCDEVLFLECSSKDIRGLKRKQIQQISEICKARGITFAIAHRYKAIYITTKIPWMEVVGVQHAFNGYKRWARRWHVQRHAHHLNLLGVSNSVRDDIRRSLSSFPSDQINTLYNRVDYKALKSGQVSREEARQALGLNANDYLFSNVGRLHPDKDQKTLIDGFTSVAAELPDSKLVILGTGRLEEALKRQIEESELQNRVLLLGQVSDAWKYFKAFDCFVLSSDHEPFGMVLLEAMAAGLPVICSACGGGQEVIGDTGWLFPLGDIQKLSEQMIAVHSMKNQDIDKVKSEMDLRVTRMFSDEKAKEVFLALSFVKKFMDA